MLFGNKKSFAIQCDLGSHHLKYVFANVCFWAGDQSIGDCNQAVILWPVFDHLQTILRYEGQRHDPILENKSAEEVLSTIYGALYQTLEGLERPKSKEEINRERMQYEKFDIVGNSSEAFDGVCIVLLEDKESERLIWRTYDMSFASEVRLAQGEFEMVVRAFVAAVSPLFDLDNPRAKL